MKKKLFILFSSFIMINDEKETYSASVRSSSTCGTVELDFNELLNQHHSGETNPDPLINEISNHYKDLERSVWMSDLANNRIEETQMTADLNIKIKNLVTSIEKLPEQTDSLLFKNLKNLKFALLKTQKRQSTHFEYLEALSTREKTFEIFSNFNDLSKKIMTKYSISMEKYAPLLLAQKEENKIIQFLDVTTDQSVIEVKCDDFFYDLYSKSSQKIKNILDGVEYSGLNQAFALQALGEIFLKNHGLPFPSPLHSNMEKIFIAQYYLGLSQISLGVVDELLFIKNVVRTLSTSSIALEEIGTSFLSKATAGFNFAMSLFNVGADTAGIVSADSHKIKEIYGAKLGFDLGGLALAAGSWVAPELGPLAVPFAGTAFGGMMLAERMAELTDVTFQYGKEFEKIKNDYTYNAAQFMSQPAPDEDVFLSFAYNFSAKDPDYNRSVIKSIDLSVHRKIDVKFGSNFILKTEHTQSRDQSNNYNCVFCQNPSEEISEYEFDHHALFQDNYLPIRELANIPEQKELDLRSEAFHPLYKQGGLKILLPINPPSYFWYEYGPSPGILGNYYREQAPTVFEMQDRSHGQFFFAFGEPIMDQGISKMKMRFEATKIHVLLGRETIDLLTPKIPEIWKNKITFHLEGKDGGRYNIYPKKDAQYVITGSGYETFYIVMNADSKYSLDHVEINENQIVIDGIQFSFDKARKPKNVFIQYKRLFGTDFANFDVSTSKLAVTKINLSDYDVQPHQDLNDIKSFVMQKTQNFSQEGYIEISPFPLKQYMMSNGLSLSSWSVDDSENKFIRGYWSLKNFEFISNQDQHTLSGLKISYPKSIVGHYQKDQYYFDNQDHQLYYTQNNQNMKLFFSNSHLKISQIFLMKKKIQSC